MSHDPFWLGAQLVESGSITPEQFSGARNFWRHAQDESFESVLETLGLATPRVLGGLIARRHGLPMVSLHPLSIDREAGRLIDPAAARAHGALPFRLEENRLHVAVADPAEYGPTRAAKDFPDHAVCLHVAPRRDILRMIDECWRPAQPAESDAKGMFEALVREAAEEGATDLHLEPRDHCLEVRRRIDGRLIHKCFVGPPARDALVQAAKLAGRLDIAERRLPQDGQGALDCGSRRFRLRFSCLPAINGESIVVRVIDEHAASRPFEDMGLLPSDAQRLAGLLEQPCGLIYATGPTGSGKTTLLHALLANLPPSRLHATKIVTLEEPVETRNPRHFVQVSVEERIGRSFGELLRHVLRHDPDVILVGETRDPATAQITLRAALTGRLCLSTLHTHDALGSIVRLEEMGLDPLMLASALRGVIAQRLVRRLCKECSRPHPQGDLLASTHRELLVRGLGAADKPAFHSPGDRDCPACGGRGYRGRIPIVEIFPLGGLDRMIAERRPAPEILGRLRERGCRTLFEDGVLKAALGLTTMEEVHAAVETPAIIQS